VDLAAVAAVHDLLGADPGDVAAVAPQRERDRLGLAVGAVRALDQARDVAAVVAAGQQRPGGRQLDRGRRLGGRHRRSDRERDSDAHAARPDRAKPDDTRRRRGAPDQRSEGWTEQDDLGLALK
jgi:hypothetical protein